MLVVFTSRVMSLSAIFVLPAQGTAHTTKKDEKQVRKVTCIVCDKSLCETIPLVRILDKNLTLFTVVNKWTQKYLAELCKSCRSLGRVASIFVALIPKSLCFTPTFSVESLWSLALCASHKFAFLVAYLLMYMGFVLHIRILFHISLWALSSNLTYFARVQFAITSICVKILFVLIASKCLKIFTPIKGVEKQLQTSKIPHK